MLSATSYPDLEERNTFFSIPFLFIIIIQQDEKFIFARKDKDAVVSYSNYVSS